MKEIFQEGGPIMYFILAFSIAGIFVVIERLIYFFTVERGNTEQLKEELMELIASGNLEGAKELCASYDNSASRVLGGILENYGESRETLEEKVREVALSQIPTLEKFMWILGITAHVSPLMGLLGTVTGMIKAFEVIAKEGVGKPEILAAGISEALITTASGLTVAIPAVIMYNFLNKKIDRIVNDMEKASVEFMNALSKSK